MADLKELRREIDRTDSEIVRLFERRMHLVADVAQYKIENGMQVLDSRRESEKLKTLSEGASTDFNETAVREIFRQMMAISRKRQYQILTEHGQGETLPFGQCDAFDFEGSRVVFQGVEGAYSFAAMRTFFGDAIDSVHVETWREAMQMVADGDVDYGVVPIENSTAGSVSDIYDLLADFPIYIVGEQVIPINHRLLGIPGAKKETIRTVYSHPQALAQCRAYLEAHPQWECVPVLNTAIAAEKVADEQDPAHAAIASETAAEFYGLKVLEEGPISRKKNATRFVILSNRCCFVRNARKISICFELPHQCGTLYNVLSHFIFNELNMTRIESRPIPDKTWEYRFFIDFEGNLNDPGVQNALFGIRAETADLRLLGSC
ncbi:MAG: prephenate dehydratase [Lachnospiraceae bacterium]|jgi:chorismate mutase/prephenate dehydratase|nr:prephenate dehydratase [Lachnospiraceae bacterium]MCI1328950.1 prephenate dehydratase [Lachnospiraceae bacterium]